MAGAFSFEVPKALWGRCLCFFPIYRPVKMGGSLDCMTEF